VPDLPSESELLAVAEEAARAAGAVLVERFGGRQEALAAKSSPTDPVGEADLAAERAIREILATWRPDDALLGEEGGAAAGSSGLSWTVDPLDGTVNYLFGLPQWAVSVAVDDPSGTLVGVVLDPLREEAWTATRSGPALCDGRPVTGSSRDELGHALVATGFGYDPGVRAAQAEAVARLLPRVRDIRRIGAAALDLAWAAGGRFDAYYERGLQAWDVAAGRLLCERAGLAVVELPPAPPQGAGILVAPSALVPPLRELVG
jgi:myo-inositol-1(or 4)-monophosphatase